MTWLTTKQAAGHLGLSLNAFDLMTRKKGIPCVWVGCSRRFDAAVLDKLVRTNLLASPRRASGRLARRVS